VKTVYSFILVILAVILTSTATSFLMDRSRIIQADEYPMDVKVTDNGIIGINVDSDGLHFGSPGRGGSSEREIIVNNVQEDVLATITKSGEIAGWVSSPKNVIIKKGEETSLVFSINIPLNASLGNHTGKAVIVLRKM